ncbi:hypothetical protein EAF00_001547 [Botryotinia globosa]|nr:hypothetical protein EAF00_001547 [Botryotinia globosa]
MSRNPVNPVSIPKLSNIGLGTWASSILIRSIPRHAFDYFNDPRASIIIRILSIAFSPHPAISGPSVAPDRPKPPVFEAQKIAHIQCPIEITNLPYLLP